MMAPGASPAFPPPRTLFTVEHANRTLPLVRRIVGDIVDSYRQWQALVAEYDLATAASTPDGAADARVLQGQIQRTARDIDAYTRELNDLGIEMKGLGDGLIDFPGEIDGRPVYLCWRLGEPAVEFYHELDTGFAGRLPLTPSASAETHSNPAST